MVEAYGFLCRSGENERHKAMRADAASGRVSFPAGTGGAAISIMGNSGMSIGGSQTRFLTPGLCAGYQAGVRVPVPVSGLTCITSVTPRAGESWTFTLQMLFPTPRSPA